MVVTLVVVALFVGLFVYALCNAQPMGRDDEAQIRFISDWRNEHDQPK